MGGTSTTAAHAAGARQYLVSLGGRVEPRVLAGCGSPRARCWVLREQPALGVLLHDGSGRSVEPLLSGCPSGRWGW
jgi:hypothetical protein